MIAHSSSDGRPRKLGRVRSFDERRGVGEIVSDDGTTFGFHSTAIAGGSRKIAVETVVEFDVVAGLPGRWEAGSIEKLAG